MEGLAMLETKITNVLTDASSKKLIQHSKLSKLECILQLTISRWQAEPLKKGSRPNIAYTVTGKVCEGHERQGYFNPAKDRQLGF